MLHPTEHYLRKCKIEPAITRTLTSGQPVWKSYGMLSKVRTLSFCDMLQWQTSFKCILRKSWWGCAVFLACRWFVLACSLGAKSSFHMRNPCAFSCSSHIVWHEDRMTPKSSPRQGVFSTSPVTDGTWYFRLTSSCWENTTILRCLRKIPEIAVK